MPIDLTTTKEMKKRIGPPPLLNILTYDPPGR
jgi:hypothetical protein